MNDRMGSGQNGFTLLELVISSILVITIIGATLSLQFANDRMYVVAVAERELLQEINLAMSHLHRELRRWGSGYKISIDSASPTQIIRVLNSSDNVVAKYEWDDASDQFRYYPTGSGSYEVVASKISAFTITYTDPDLDGKVAYFTLLIKAKGEWGNMLAK